MASGGGAAGPNSSTGGGQGSASAMIRHPFCPNTGMVASWGVRILVDHLGKEVDASLHHAVCVWAACARALGACSIASSKIERQPNRLRGMLLRTRGQS